MIIITTENLMINGTGLEQFSDLSPGPHVCLTVEDSGHGINSETLDRIFEPFFSTKFQGRGLGLAAAYGIVNNHNGAISVISQPDEGTIFKVYLPAMPVH